MPSSWSTLPVLEAAVWRDFLDLWRDDDPSVVRDLLMEFIADARKHQGLMLNALSSADARALEFSAHSLKSSCGNLGAYRLQEICRVIQDLARDQALHVASDYLRHFDNVLTLTHRAFIDEFPELAKTS